MSHSSKELSGKIRNTLKLALNFFAKYPRHSFYISATTFIIVLVFGATVFKTNWGMLFGSWHPNKALFIERVNVVSEFPLRDETLEKIKKGENIPSFSVNVPRDGVTKLPGMQSLKFGEQLELGFAKLDLIKKDKAKNQWVLAKTDQSIVGSRFAMYVDIDTKVNQIKNQHLYLFSTWAPYEIFEGERWVGNGDALSMYRSGGQIVGNSNPTRLIIVFNQKQKDSMGGINNRYGLSILSDSELTNVQQNGPIKDLFSRLTSGTVYFVIAAIMFILAIVSGFLDIYLFAAVCCILAYIGWTETPAFYLGKSGDWLSFERLCSYGLTTLLLFFMSLAFFRIDRMKLSITDFRIASRAFINDCIRWKRSQIKPIVPILLKVSMISICSVICALGSFWILVGFGYPFSLVFSWVGIGIVVGLIIGQFEAFSMGFKELNQTRISHLQKGDERLADAITERLHLSRLYCGSVVILSLFFGGGIPARSFSVGADIWLLSSIAPIGVLIGIIFRSVAQTNRIAAMFRNQIMMIHYYYEKYREAVFDKSFYGVIAVTDLAGMSAIGAFSTKHGLGISILDEISSRVEHDVHSLLGSSLTLFNTKSNGDQDILAINATSVEQSKELLGVMLMRWKSGGPELLKSWREALLLLLPPELHEEGRLLALGLDLHIFMGAYSDMKIRKLRNGSLDSMSMRWIEMAALEKPSQHNKVGIDLRDSDIILKALGKNVTITPMTSVLGFVEWESNVPRGNASPKLQISA